MKRITIGLLAILGSITVACGASETSHDKKNAKIENYAPQQTKSFKNVTVSDLNTAIEQGEDVVIIDVRTQGEVASGHVDGAQNMDINNPNFKSKASKLDKNQTVYVYCRSGVRSQNASKVLVSMGFTDVRNVTGGFNAWLRSGYKVVK